MAKLFNNKYRIPSARLQNWNYANDAMYFVTICTKYKVKYFGDIVNNIPKLEPTEIGKIASSEWYKTTELRPDMNLELGEFVVMPDHIHGIIIIGANTIPRIIWYVLIAIIKTNLHHNPKIWHLSCEDINLL